MNNLRGILLNENFCVRSSFCNNLEVEIHHYSDGIIQYLTNEHKELFYT